MLHSKQLFSPLLPIKHSTNARLDAFACQKDIKKAIVSPSFVDVNTESFIPQALSLWAISIKYALSCSYEPKIMKAFNPAYGFRYFMQKAFGLH